MTKSYYDILEISKHASQLVITAAYKSLSNKYHPDKNHGSEYYEQKMATLNVAYEVLSDPIKRKSYDEELDKQQKPLNDSNVVDSPVNVNTPTVHTLGNASIPSFLIFLFILLLIISLLFGQKQSSTETQLLKTSDESTQAGESKWRLAEQLLNGDGVPKNYKKAHSEYISIATQNLFSDGRAEQRLAEIFFYGLGVNVNYADALSWYKRADNLKSKFMIGMIYMNGLGVKKDLVLAYHYFNDVQARKYDLYPVESNKLIHDQENKIYFKNPDEEKLFKKGYDGWRPYFSNLALMKMKLLETKLTQTEILEAQNMEVVN